MRLGATSEASKWPTEAVSVLFSPSHDSRMCHLLDIVYQAEQLPLRVHFLLAPQRKPIHPLIPHIAKHRLHYRDPLVINKPPVQRVKLPLHPFDRSVLLLLFSPDEDRYVLDLGALWSLETALPQRTRPAQPLACSKPNADKP